jgi:hypothetical protein
VTRDSNESLLPVADGGLDVEDLTFIFGFLGCTLRSTGFDFFGGGVGSSFSEEELELDDFSSSSESNIVGRFYCQN